MTQRRFLLQELPYRAADSCGLFAHLAHRPWSALLDSGRPAASGGRYDLLVADPIATLVTQGEVTTLQRGAALPEISQADPLVLLAELLTELPACPLPAEVPFAGGALGWFGYDLARRLALLPPLPPATGRLPELAVGIYPWAVVVDHQLARSWLAGHFRPGEAEQLARQLGGPAPPQRGALSALAPVQHHTDAAAYRQAIQRIHHYLREGDCYQVNFAQRFSVPVAGDAWAGYCQLRQRNPAPFGAYLNTPFGQVLSCSPERFLQVDRAGRVETRPIKGTVARGGDPAADAAAQAWLVASEKDRAENLMIVDLLRNDLGRICATGSIAVPSLFAVESFATVHHLISTVTGQLAPGRSALDLLAACFPGGSITGAPKRRAMAIIDELEGHPRGLYCGSIAWLGWDGAMDSNIAIRTLTIAAGEAEFWAGGGVVYDSQWEGEYRESLAKAQALLEFCYSIVR